VTTTAGGTTAAERFDAVAVCNGHYAEPRVPDLPGMGAFPGALLHSHNYREPERFRDTTVAVLGASASGVDLARELGTVARRAYWCAESFPRVAQTGDGSGPVERRAAIAALKPDGSLTLQDGTTVPRVDAVLLCTGYRYHFPFLGSDLIRVVDNWVQPLWQDLLHVEHPDLAFIGIPFRVVPFPLFEVQARWFARLLAGHVILPPLPDRVADTAKHIAALLAHVAAYPSNYREVPIDDSPRPRHHHPDRREHADQRVRGPGP
jgi:hypothetical protein